MMAPSREQRRLSLCVLLVLQVLQARRRRLREERIRRARARLERFRRFQNRLRSERAIFLATLAMLASEVHPPPPPTERHAWMNTHDSEWWESNCDWTELEWLENLRMTRTTFEFLCDELSETLRKETDKVDDQIPVDKQVALTLWKLATNAEYKTIERVFGVSKSSVCKILEEVCNAIVSQFADRYMNFADAAGLRAIADGFERRWGLPQCVGAVDCIHIPILAPTATTGSSSDGNSNPSGSRSIIAQIAVDDDYCITDLHVGDANGSLTDSDFFATTPLCQRGKAGTLFPVTTTTVEVGDDAVKENGLHKPESGRAIDGVTVPYFLAADENYPLLDWIMTPFPEEPDQFSRQEESFNEILEDVHHVAEEAWTRLKGRWRCLQTRNDGVVEFVTLLVRACCVLHNICERNKHPFLQEWVTAGPGDFKMEVVASPSLPTSFGEAGGGSGGGEPTNDWRSGSAEAQKIRMAIAGNAARDERAVGHPLDDNSNDDTDKDCL